MFVRFNQALQGCLEGGTSRACLYIWCFTCSEVYEGSRWFWGYSDAHGLPDAIDAADVTRGHLASQLRQVPGHLLSCGDIRMNIIRKAGEYTNRVFQFFLSQTQENM